MDDLVAAFRQVWVVRGNDEGGAVSVAEFEQKSDYLFAGVGVEVLGGLVGEHDARLVDECACDRDLAAVELEGRENSPSVDDRSSARGDSLCDIRGPYLRRALDRRIGRCSDTMASVMNPASGLKTVTLTLHPQRWGMVACLVLGTLGLVFVATGIVVAGESSLGFGMIGGGAFAAYYLLSAALSSVTVTPDGVRYRRGFVLRSIPVGEIQRIEAAPTRRRGRPRIALAVHRHRDEAVPLVSTERFDSPTNRQVLTRQATEAAEILGLS
jgi:hypothetical protein